MAINYDLYSKERIDKMKKLKNQSQGQEVDPNLVDMAMAEQNVINRQPVQGSDSEMPEEFKVERQMAEVESAKVQKDSDDFLKMNPEDQVRFFATLPPETKYAVEMKMNAQQEQLAANPELAPKGNVPFAEGMLPQGTPAPVRAPISFTPMSEQTPSAQVEQQNAARTPSSTSGSNSMLNRGLKMGEQGINDYAKVMAEEAKLKSQEAEQLAKNQEAENIARENIYKEFENDYAVKKQERDDARQKWLTSTVDSGRIFRNQTTNQKVMTGIGVFLGALGNALTGETDISKNPALMAIDKAVENDIRSQELEMAKLKDNVGLVNNELSELVKMYGDKDKAKAELFARKNLAIGLQMKSLIERNAGLKANPLAQQAMSNLLMKGSEAQAAIDLKDAQVSKLQAEAAASKVAPVAVSGVVESIDQVPLKQRESAVALPSGKIAVSPFGKAAAAEVRKFVGDAGNAVNELGQVLSLTQGQNFYNPYGELKSKVDSKLALVAGTLRIPITGPGAMTDTERVFLLETIGNPTKFWSLSDNQRARVQETMNTIKGRMKSSYRNAGIEVSDQDLMTREEIGKEKRQFKPVQ